MYSFDDMKPCKSDNATTSANASGSHHTEKATTIPGLSYIVVIKNLTKENDTFLTYDCVLCKSAELLTGSTMKSHLKSREHLLNVLELENYSVYEKFKNNLMISPTLLLKEINKCNTITNQRVIATTRTHDEKRRMIATKIAHLKQLSTEHSDFSSSYGDKNNINRLEVEEVQVKKKLKVYKSDNEFPAFSAILEKLAEKQRNRCPEQIIFAVDNREFYLKTEFENVKVVRTFKLTLDNAVSVLEKHEVFGKGSLIVFCCGIFSLLSCTVLNICKKMKCPSQLMKYSINSNISSDMLISKALNLQEYILNNTVNDQVMFCDIVPICISNNIKVCGNNHIFRHDIPSDIYGTYLKTVEEYNKFLTHHSTIMGLKNWNLIANSFPGQEISLTVDHFSSLGEVDVRHVSRYIIEFVKALLTNIRSDKRSLIHSPVSSQSNIPRKICRAPRAESASSVKHLKCKALKEKHTISAKYNDENISVGELLIKDEHTEDVENKATEYNDGRNNDSIHSQETLQPVEDSCHSEIQSFPGISHIIACNTTTENHTILSFDCVLCSPSETSAMTATELKVHVRTREHLLNVIDVENRSLFEKYKNNASISPAILFTEICSNTTGPPDNYITATAKSYNRKRKHIVSTISRLRRTMSPIMKIEELSVESPTGLPDVESNRETSNISNSSVDKLKVLVIGDSWVSDLAASHEEIQHLKDVDISFHYEARLKLDDIIVRVPEIVKSTHMYVMVFSIIDDAFRRSSLDKSDSQLIVPDETFRSAEYAKKLRLFVRECTKVSPKVKVIVMIPPLIDLVAYNKLKVEKFDKVLKEVYGSKMTEKLLEKRTLETYVEINKLTGPRIQWPGKVTYSLETVVQSLKNKSHETSPLKQKLLTVDRKNYLRDGIHPSFSFIQIMWDNILTTEIFTEVTDPEEQTVELSGESFSRKVHDDKSLVCENMNASVSLAEPDLSAPEQLTVLSSSPFQQGKVEPELVIDDQMEKVHQFACEQAKQLFMQVRAYTLGLGLQMTKEDLLNIIKDSLNDSNNKI